MHIITWLGIGGGAEQFPPFGFQGFDLLVDQFDPGVLPADPVAQARRERQTVPQPGLGQALFKVSLEFKPDPLIDQQSFDPVDVAGSFPFQAGQFPMQLAAIFFLEARHPHHPPDFLLTGLVTDQHRHQFAQVDPIGLDPAKTAVDFQTG
ncbi:MAG: hypothetical protein HGA82_01955 [Anaerolineales bacterium]|nr:hypothetical protein [Anaerolineales bacterium]